MKQVRVLFNYTESVIPPRCRKAREVTKNDGELSIEIPVLSSTQAPVAIRAGGKFLCRDLQFSYELRWWDDQLWSSLYVESSGEPRGCTSGQDDWDWPEIPEVLDLRQGGRNYSHKFDFYGTFGSRPREDVELDILRFAKRHVVIDGKPYRAIHEPRYVVATFGLGGNHGGTALMVDSHFNRNLSADCYFGLLELEEAIAEAARVAEARGDTKNLPMRYHGPRFEVLMPEVIFVRNPRTEVEPA